MRERGLKQADVVDGKAGRIVVPRAGTWIETFPPAFSHFPLFRRFPCGNVD